MHAQLTGFVLKQARSPAPEDAPLPRGPAPLSGVQAGLPGAAAPARPPPVPLPGSGGWRWRGALEPRFLRARWGAFLTRPLPLKPCTSVPISPVC